MSNLAARRELTDAERAAIVAEGLQSGKITETCRKHGISSASFYNWKERYPEGVVREPISVEETVGRAAMARRFTQPELDEPFGRWLVDRLHRERFQARTPLQVKGWLAAMSGSSDAWFQRTDKAVALANLVVPALSEPRVDTQFVLCGEGGKPEAVDLYNNLYLWAKNLRAVELSLPELTDVDTADLEGLPIFGSRLLFAERAFVKVKLT